MRLSDGSRIVDLVSDLSNQLAALGIRPSPDTSAPTLDHAVGAVDAAIAATADEQHVGDALELHTLLGLQLRRLEDRLVGAGALLIAAPRASNDTCAHAQVRIEPSAPHLICKECDAHVNPLWWLTRYAADLQNANEVRHILASDERRYRVKISALKAEVAKLAAQKRRLGRTG